MTAEQLPRVWVGTDEPGNHAGFFEWCGTLGWVRISGGNPLRLGCIFVPSSAPVPDFGPADMTTIATCKEVDWT